MSKKLHKVALGGLAAALVSVSGMAQADPMQAVFSIDAENPAAFLSAMDTLFESDDMSDHKVSVWAAVFDGTQ